MAVGVGIALFALMSGLWAVKQLLSGCQGKLNASTDVYIPVRRQAGYQQIVIA